MQAPEVLFGWLDTKIAQISLHKVILDESATNL